MSCNFENLTINIDFLICMSSRIVFSDSDSWQWQTGWCSTGSSFHSGITQPDRKTLLCGKVLKTCKAVSNNQSSQYIQPSSNIFVTFPQKGFFLIITLYAHVNTPQEAQYGAKEIRVYHTVPFGLRFAIATLLHRYSIMNEHHKAVLYGQAFYYQGCIERNTHLYIKIIEMDEWKFKK